MAVKAVCIRSRSRKSACEKTYWASPLSFVDTFPARGPGDESVTSASGDGTGSRSSNTRLRMENIAVLTPTPSASETMATAESSGLRRRERAA
jgi:hypothetical protein